MTFIYMIYSLYVQENTKLARRPKPKAGDSRSQRRNTWRSVSCTRHENHIIIEIHITLSSPGHPSPFPCDGTSTQQPLRYQVRCLTSNLVVRNISFTAIVYYQYLVQMYNISVCYVLINPSLLQPTATWTCRIYISSTNSRFFRHFLLYTQRKIVDKTRLAWPAIVKLVSQDTSTNIKP